jgi:hypothetical protein
MRTNELKIDASQTGATSNFTAITESISIDSTHQQAPSAKSIFDFINTDAEVLYCTSTGTTKTNLLTSTGQRITIPLNTSYIIEGRAIGTTLDISQNTSSYTFKATCKNQSSVYKLISNTVVEDVDENTLGGLALEIDTGNRLNFFVAGLSATTINWKAQLNWTSISI